MDLEPLLRAARDDEPGAWSALVPHLLTALPRYFTREFDKLDAIELSQRTLTVLTRDLPRLKPRRSLTAWMYRVARNQALTELRTLRRQAALKEAFAQLLPRSTKSPTSRVEARELLAIVREELTKLPAHYQRAIENMLEGGDIDSLAAQQGIPPATARTHQFRAIERLRRLLAARRASPPVPAPDAPDSPLSFPR